MNLKSRKIICSMCAVIFILSAFAISEAQTNKRLEADAIKYAKSYPVSKIEKGLPAKPFAVWFRESVGAKTPVSWEINDCGEQTGDPEVDKGRDFLLCVEATAKQSADFFISVNIQYGTFKRGVTRGKPVVRYISVGAEGEGEYVESLADLRKKLIQMPRTVAFFDPNGGEFVLDHENKPPGFEDFRGIYLETKDFDRRGKTISIKPKGGLETWKPQVFEMRKIFFDGRRWSFETVLVGGVSYKFDGKFIKIKRYPDGRMDNQEVLKGRLIKFSGGRQTAADLIFSFQVEDDS